MRPITGLYTLLFFLSLCLIAGCGTNSADLIEKYNSYGIKSAKMGLWNEALMRWKRIVEMEPNNAKARNNLGVAYESQGKMKAAEAEYEVAIKLDPKNKIYKSNYERFKNHYKQFQEMAQDEGK